MELKDWLYFIGLILTFGVSVVSLLINIKNRKNVLREHLYKEQINFFYKINAEFSSIGKLFDDIVIEKMYTEEQNLLIQTHLDNLHKIIDTHDFIIPNEIFTKLHLTQSESSNFHIRILQTNGRISKQQLDNYFNYYYYLVEDMREFAGVDELSDENKKLYQNKKNKK